MKPFEVLYREVRGIVYKSRKEYYIHGWEKEDWDQEGMLMLHRLLVECPEIVNEGNKLYVYYKVKFRNYLKDVIRKQESQKRKFDRMRYEEVSELSHSIKSPGLVTDDLLTFRSLLKEYRSSLSSEKQIHYDLFIQGKSFKGKKAMATELALHLKDFKGG